jgi:hypothetical protein
MVVMWLAGCMGKVLESRDIGKVHGCLEHSKPRYVVLTDHGSMSSTAPTKIAWKPAYVRAAVKH